MRVRIGDAECEAVASDGTFEVEPGRLAFAPWGSGWAEPGGAAARRMEPFLRVGDRAYRGRLTPNESAGASTPSGTRTP